MGLQRPLAFFAHLQELSGAFSDVPALGCGERPTGQQADSGQALAPHLGQLGPRAWPPAVKLDDGRCHQQAMLVRSGPSAALQVSPRTRAHMLLVLMAYSRANETWDSPAACLLRISATLVSSSLAWLLRVPNRTGGREPIAMARQRAFSFSPSWAQCLLADSLIFLLVSSEARRPVSI